MPFPFIRETVQAAILSATSNVLAQGITAYQEDRTLALDPYPILRFVTFAILNTPPNCAWQEWLETTFPASVDIDVHAIHPDQSNARKVEDRAEKSKVEQGNRKEPRRKSRINVRNTLIKFGLDQTFGAVVNTIAFVAGMGALNGLGWDAIVGSVKEDSLHIYSSGVKFWPAVSLVSFALVPLEKRVLFGGLVGVAWGIFLSMQAHS